MQNLAKILIKQLEELKSTTEKFDIMLTIIPDHFSSVQGAGTLYVFFDELNCANLAKGIIDKISESLSSGKHIEYLSSRQFVWAINTISETAIVASRELKLTDEVCDNLFSLMYENLDDVDLNLISDMHEIVLSFLELKKTGNFIPYSQFPPQYRDVIQTAYNIRNLIYS